jgi:hypothetical protein
MSQHGYSIMSASFKSIVSLTRLSKLTSKVKAKPRRSPAKVKPKRLSFVTA